MDLPPGIPETTAAHNTLAQIIALAWAVIGGGLWAFSFFRERKKAESAPPAEYQLAGIELADMKPARDLVRTLAPRLERVFEMAERSTVTSAENREMLVKLIAAQDQVREVLEHIEQRMVRQDIRAEERERAEDYIRRHRGE